MKQFSKIYHCQQGNVVLMVSFFSLIALGFFIFLSASMMKMLDQTFNLRNAYLANNVAESTIEQSIVEYINNPVYVNESNDLCVNSNQTDQSIIDFLNCAGGDKIGSIERKVSRYQPVLSGYLDRYATAEIWLTDSEQESGYDLANINNLTLEWNASDTNTENAGITVIIARWPKNMPQNIQSNHILLDPQPGPQSVELKDFRRQSGSDDGTDFKMGANGHEYLIVLRAGNIPTHYKLSGNEYLPDKNLTVQVKTIVEDQRDQLQTIIRQFEVRKELYSNHDSSFPYVRHLMQ